MNYFKLYLLKNNLDINKLVEINNEQLDTYENIDIKDYTCETIILISRIVTKSPGDVLNELINLEINESGIANVYTPSELLMKLNEKQEIIIIGGEYCNEIYNLMKSQMTEYELMGFATQMSILIYAISKLKNCFVSHDKMIANNIELKLKGYELIDMSSNKLVLSLKNNR